MTDTSSNEAPSNDPLPEGAAALFNEAADDGRKTPPETSWTPPDPAHLSAQFPDYEIVELIGRGGMGAVYRGRQRSLDREIALKLLPRELATDPEFSERFKREARAMAELNHPHIVQVYDYGQTDDGNAYYSMERVDGVDLRKVIQSGHLAEKDALSVVSQICQALHYAHEKGYVHRDIKPANIFLAADGTVKIGDFGLAKMIARSNEEALGLTMTGRAMGTPEYAAPEQVTHPETIDHRADIYSLGVLFYEMLTGEIPRGVFPPPSKRSEVDDRLDPVVMKALHSEPDRRFQAASEVGDAVTRIQENPPPPVGSPAAPQSEPHPTRKKKRSPVAITLIVLACCLLLALPLLIFAAFAMFWLTKPRLEPSAPVIATTEPVPVDIRRWPFDAVVAEGQATHSRPAKPSPRIDLTLKSHRWWENARQRAEIRNATLSDQGNQPIQIHSGETLLQLAREARAGKSKAREELEEILLRDFGRPFIDFKSGRFDLTPLVAYFDRLDAAAPGQADPFYGVTFRGEGMNKTLLKLNDLQPRTSVERLNFKDLTIDCAGKPLIDLRGRDRRLTVHASRTRFIGFDHGGQGLFSAEALTLVTADDCEFLGDLVENPSPGTVTSGHLFSLANERRPDRNIPPFPTVGFFFNCTFTGLSEVELRLPGNRESHYEFLNCVMSARPHSQNAESIVFEGTEIREKEDPEAIDAVNRLRETLSQSDLPGIP
ncbi:MAG: serine/threonine-protein kinase [Verrucomicrobiota bacterium]